MLEAELSTSLIEAERMKDSICIVPFANISYLKRFSEVKQTLLLKTLTVGLSVTLCWEMGVFSVYLPCRGATGCSRCTQSGLFSLAVLNGSWSSRLTAVDSTTQRYLFLDSFSLSCHQKILCMIFTPGFLLVSLFTTPTWTKTELSSITMSHCRSSLHPASAEKGQITTKNAKLLIPSQPQLL